ncbi:MAG: 4'-phosphopantetheinyl transferase superfamily protein [Ferruginibacter sp.]
MPLVYQQNINEATKLAVWHITEQEDFFLQKVMLPNAITHPHKRLQHLAGRYLLPELFENFPLALIRIADTKKPFLADEAYHFSISHCGDYVAAIASKANRVGVDIEVISEIVKRIKDKFLSRQEQVMIEKTSELNSSISYLQLLTLAWSVKETMFKWYGHGAVDFREHLHIKNISLRDKEFLAQCELVKNEPVQLNPHGLIFNDNLLTWLVT